MDTLYGNSYACFSHVFEVYLHICCVTYALVVKEVASFLRLSQLMGIGTSVLSIV